MQKKISLVIPSWFEKNQNGKYGKEETFLIASECLFRLLKVINKDDTEIIIINNGSTLKDDDLLEHEIEDIGKYKYTITEYFQNANILIENKINKGFACAVNQGINVATGEFVMQLNNDLLVWEGFLEQMIEDFKLAETFSPPAGLLMPAIVKDKISFFDIIKMDKSEIDMQTNAGKFAPKAEFGSCYIGRKEMFMKIAKNRDGYQVLDENYKWGYGEDRWLYREIRMLGKETWRTHNLRVFHVGGLSMSKIKKQEGVREAIDRNREYLAEQKKKFNID